MKIINKSKNTILSDNAVLANTPLKRVKGLLGRDSLADKEALILSPCNSIHTFFMRFAIDVVFVDKNNKVIKVIPSLKPFMLSPIYFNASFCIEFPCGSVKPTNTSAGDIISIE